MYTPDGAMLTDKGLKAHRDAYCHAIRDYHAQGTLAGTWPLHYLIRHTTTAGNAMLTAYNHLSAA